MAIRDLLNRDKPEPTRKERARQRYDAWRETLDRYRSAIASLEAAKADADSELGKAVEEAVEAGAVALTAELKDAAATAHTCNVLLERLEPLYRAERRRDLSPTPHVRMRPVRVDTSADGTDMSGVLGGAFEAVPEGEAER